MPTIIENPILTSPYREPTRHFRFDEDGITIRDRLRVLMPNAPDNYYQERDILPPDLYRRLQQDRGEGD